MMTKKLNSLLLPNLALAALLCAGPALAQEDTDDGAPDEDRWLSPALTRRLGRDQLPIRIARARVAAEGPDIHHLGNPVGIALDDPVFLVAHHVHLLGDETHRDQGDPVFQPRILDFGGFDGDNLGLEGFARFLAGDQGDEAPPPGPPTLFPVFPKNDQAAESILDPKPL